MYCDEDFMAIALRLAKRGLGNVAPNPAVGCVIVNNNVIVGRGWTQKGGRPHAEIVALNCAQDLAQGATAYVTLEPCCHYGQTKPCVLKLINAKIKKVVIASYDPDERVCGKGIKMLQESGIEVINNVMNKEAKELNIGFFCCKKKHRPFIAVKIATSLDGKIACANGQSKWITNSLTRSWVHKQRCMYDAIMIGSNTLVQDNPQLTCRLPGLETSFPTRIVVDRSGKLNSNHYLAQTANIIKTYILTDNYPQQKIDHVNYLIVKSHDNLFLTNAMEKLTEIGITRILVEGGGTLISEMLKQNLVDRFMWCRSNAVFGNDSLPAIGNLQISNPQQCYNFRKTQTLHFQEDIVEILDYDQNIY